MGASKAFCEVNSVFFSISELGSIILSIFFLSAAALAHRLRGRGLGVVINVWVTNFSGINK